MNKHLSILIGKWEKISIDSATMMNKVFEIIEAKHIFSIKYKNLSILTHPESYVHSIIKFNNGLIKLIAHKTDMKIPIFNSIYTGNDKFVLKHNEIDLSKLNRLDLKKIDLKKFPIVNIIKYLPEYNSLFETIIVSANDELVKLFLTKKIKFTDISKKLMLFIKKPEFKKYKLITPKNVEEIIELNNYVRLKINPESI